jgi:carboxypeptidase C (cathepsin A)
MERGKILPKISYILEEGIKVALVYGDRDYACNWIGGERTSLAIEYTDSEEFRSAGYIPVWLDDFSIAGQVRQYGNLSFTRVYQAGHMGKSCIPLTIGGRLTYFSAILSTRSSI